MSWKKPYQWLMDNHTAYEIRRDMRVRESRHTCMIWPKKYLNYETNKWDTNKLETIARFSWQDHMVPEHYFITELVNRYYRDNFDLDKYPSLKYEWDF